MPSARKQRHPHGNGACGNQTQKKSLTTQNRIGCRRFANRHTRLLSRCRRRNVVRLSRRLLRLGLQDTYAHGASRAYLMKEYGLDAPALVRGIEKLLGRSTGVSDADLDAARIEQVHSLAKAEGL